MPCEQNVPVPFSADGSRTGSKPLSTPVVWQILLELEVLRPGMSADEAIEIRRFWPRAVRATSLNIFSISSRRRQTWFTTSVARWCQFAAKIWRLSEQLLLPRHHI